MKKGLLWLVSACFLMACLTGTAMAAETDSGQKSAHTEDIPSEENVDGAKQDDTGGSGAAGEAAEAEGAAGERSGAKEAAEEPPSVEGFWAEEGGDWRYLLPDGTYLTRDWLYYKGQWYYFSSDSYMVRGSAKVNGKNYFFLETGEMAKGWVYDEEEDKWYYLDEDGVKTTGWLQAGGVWYWFDSKGAMFNEGFRMVSGHKYYFFSNGQMAADQYVGLHYYNSDGLRDRQYDIVLQGDRKPTDEEEAQITEIMENIPGVWIKKMVESGWELMYYTDKNYFSAPSTEQGVYYVYHKTDINYKKLKFTKPESLAMAIGEYIAHDTKNDKEDNAFMADYQQYLSVSSNVQPLPSYFDSKPGMWFGSLFESYIRPEIRYDMKWESPQLAQFMEETLRVDMEEWKPSMEELEDRILEEYGVDSYGPGPSTDEELGNQAGPAKG